MALYFYRALSKTGKKISGHIDASSEEMVRSDLSLKGLYPIEIRLKTEAKSSFFKSLFERPVSPKDLIFFTKQLAILLKSGVPLAQALELLTEQFTGKLKSIVIALKDGVKEGKSLAQGLQDYPKTFSNIYIQLVKAGEATGKLEVILDRLTTYLERQAEIQKRVSSALRQPLIQLGVILAVTTVMMTAVVPQLAGMLKKTGKELPGITEFLIRASDFLVNNYVAILAGLVALIIVFEYWRSTPKGKRAVDTIKLKTPLVKHFAQTGAIVQFCNTLGMLIESGVTLSQALDIVCNIIDNSILVETLEQAKDKIIKQGKITPFLKETGLFPPMAIYLINTGEQSGNLDFMLLTVAKNYETELADLSDNLTESLPQIMTIVMGLVIGGIMFAVMSPMMSMYDMSGM